MSASILSSLALSAGYVGCLYVQPTGLPRDHPETMRRRMLAVGLFTGIVAPLFCWGLQRGAGLPLQWVDLGLTPNWRTLVVAPLRAVGVFGLLFLGPLLELALTWRERAPEPHSLMIWRNYVVAPVTEEIVYRAMVLALLQTETSSTSVLVLGSPLFFGLAHVHHLWAGVPWPAVLGQFGFTTLFGWLNAWTFLRLESCYAAIAAHSFCNYMGLPTFGQGVAPHWRLPVGLCYVTGLAAFAYCFPRL